jgi:signal-transduction protein with cAMP-binding, CBS, and nucleotidyltransferase domain
MISLFRKLEEGAYPEIQESIKHSAYSKGEYLIQEDKPCRYLWLVESGQLRVFRRKGCDEPTLYFYFPGEPVMMYPIFAPLSIANANVQFITNGTVYAIPCSSLQKLRIKFPLFAIVELLAVECRNHMLEDRVFDLLFTDAPERYQNLLTNHKLYLQTLSLTHIVDYMGIRQ